MKEATLYQKLDNNRVQCNACAFRCKINPENTGICGVRKNCKGKLRLLVYGRAIADNVDPIEKKPLYHFLPGTDVFSIGTIGCNFKCGFCQNWDISQMSESGELFADSCEATLKSKNLDKQYPIQDIGVEWLPEKIVKHCLKNNIPSIAYTYNEPTIFFEYTYDTAILAHEKGLKNIYVSNGYATNELVDEISPYLDAINIDLKSFSNKFYLSECGAKLDPVLKGIEMFVKAGVWVEITTLVIPNENDSQEELEQIAKFIANISKDIPWHISRFHSDYKMQKCDVTPIETLKKAYDIGKKAGLNHVYVGNIEMNGLENTFCPKCEELLIERNLQRIVLKGIQDGVCDHCSNDIKGVWH
jgi:pyruvate formate lyase activating enzyme